MREEEHCNLSVDDSSTDSEEPICIKLVKRPHEEIIFHLKLDVFLVVCEAAENHQQYNSCIQILENKAIVHNCLIVARTVLTSIIITQVLERQSVDYIHKCDPAANSNPCVFG